MLLRLGMVAGGSHSWEPETSSVALTSSEYAIPQSLLLLPFLVMVAVTAAAAVGAIHRHLSRTTVQCALPVPLLFLLRCLCVVALIIDG